MTVSIHFEGDPAAVRYEAAVLFGFSAAPALAPQPATSEVGMSANAAPAEAAKPRGRGKKADEKAAENITTTASENNEKANEQPAEEITSPAAPEPDAPPAEVQAQDAADEAAEVPPAVEPTIDDVRDAGNRYAKKFGAPAWLADQKDIMASAGVPAIPLKEQTPDAYGKLIAALNAAIENNPKNRAVA